MMSEKKVDENRLEALLRGEADPQLKSILASLDMVYASGPDTDMTRRAFTAVDRAIEDSQTAAVGYDRLEETPFGDLFVAVTEAGVIALAFGGSEAQFRASLQGKESTVIRKDPERVRRTMEQLGEYFDGARGRFDLSFDLRGLTAFQRAVLTAVQKVPKGSYVSYREIAERIGKPGAARAVGQALGRNPIPILIPCHRVISTDGTLGGYSAPGGVETKLALLKMEGAAF